MVDSVDILISLSSQEREKVVSTLKSGKANIVKEVALVETGEIRIEAIIDGVFRCYLRGEYLKVVGSLSQFYHNAYDSLHFNETTDAINKLSAEVGTDLRRGTLYRLDIEATFTANFPIASYFEYFGEKRFFRRTVEQNTLYYKNTNRLCLLYDKGKKIRSVSGKESCRDNLMRIEARLKRGYLKQVEERLDIREFTVGHLESPSVQLFLLNYWLDEIKSIEQNPQLIIDLTDVNDLRDFRNQIEVQGIESLGGVSKVLSMIENYRPYNENLDSKAISRIKRFLKDLKGKASKVINGDHLTEFNFTVAVMYIQIYLSINESN